MKGVRLCKGVCVFLSPRLHATCAHASIQSTGRFKFNFGKLHTSLYCKLCPCTQPIYAILGLQPSHTYVKMCKRPRSHVRIKTCASVLLTPFHNLLLAQATSDTSTKQPSVVFPCPTAQHEVYLPQHTLGRAFTTLTTHQHERGLSNRWHCVAQRRSRRP